MPVEFTTAMIPLVEVFHLGDQVLQLCGQRHKNLLAAPGPSAGIQDLNVHTVSCREEKEESAAVRQKLLFFANKMTHILKKCVSE